MFRTARNLLSRPQSGLAFAALPCLDLSQKTSACKSSPPKAPTSWETLQTYSKDPQGCFDSNESRFRFDREDEDIQRYQRFKRWAIARGHGHMVFISDYVVLTAEWRKTDEGTRIALQPNMAPYSLEKGIEHWVLWYHPADVQGSADLDKSVALQHLRAFIPTLSEDEIAMFQNLPTQRSIPQMAHMHVFFLHRYAGADAHTFLKIHRERWALQSPWAEAERIYEYLKSQGYA